jgi:hypothetical protein
MTTTEHLQAIMVYCKSVLALIVACSYRAHHQDSGCEQVENKL